MSLAVVDLHKQVLLNATPAQLWPLISDTSRVNRLIGLPAFSQPEPDGDLSQIIHATYIGLPVSWREYPFQWVSEQWHEVERVFFAPIPIERIITSTTLSAKGAQTLVEVRVRLVNRNPLGWAAARLLVGRRLLRDVVRVYQQFAAAAQVASNAPMPISFRARVNEARLVRGLESLARTSVAPSLIDQLGAHLSNADDSEVLKMRPFALAEQWQAERLAVLKLCLYATRSGLLELEWDVICPNCRGTSVRMQHLGDLTSEAHCPACNIRYGVNFDEAVELRFSVSPEIRAATDVSFCIGGPANTRHIRAQLRIPAGTTLISRFNLPVGSYRLRNLRDQHSTQLEIEAAASATTTHITATNAGIVCKPYALAAGDCELHITNSGATDLLLVVEERAWTRLAASAALVTTLDEFRMLFSSEVLAPGLGLAVRNLTFLFSDLKDSTTMYDTLGDAPAYARVRDHFSLLRTIIGDWRGALVKTIGDAVMAVFANPEDAVEAALEIQREFIAGEIAQGRPALRVKLGIHRGSCIAVNANDLLDYFGSTVNVAARIQNESIGGDIVVSQAVLNDPSVQTVLARTEPVIEQFERELKGIRQRATLYRLSGVGMAQLISRH